MLVSCTDALAPGERCSAGHRTDEDCKLENANWGMHVFCVRVCLYVFLCVVCDSQRARAQVVEAGARQCELCCFVAEQEVERTSG